MTKDKKSLNAEIPDSWPANPESNEVMVNRGETGVGIYVLSLGWNGPHQPWYKYRCVQRLSARASEEEIEKAVEKTKNSKKYFGTCAACGTRVLIGYMFDDVCQGCAPGKYGVVF